MNTSAIILMVLTQVVVTAFTVYFFIKVLRSPKRPEPDSFDENDDLDLGL
jgi:heme/copper-type cytochrome/quinol oxidase subunit 2